MGPALIVDGKIILEVCGPLRQGVCGSLVSHLGLFLRPSPTSHLLDWPLAGTLIFILESWDG